MFGLGCLLNSSLITLAQQQHFSSPQPTHSFCDNHCWCTLLSMKNMKMSSEQQQGNVLLVTSSQLFSHFVSGDTVKPRTAL